MKDKGKDMGLGMVDALPHGPPGGTCRVSSSAVVSPTRSLL